MSENTHRPSLWRIKKKKKLYEAFLWLTFLFRAPNLLYCPGPYVKQTWESEEVLESSRFEWGIQVRTGTPFFESIWFALLGQTGWASLKTGGLQDKSPRRLLRRARACAVSKQNKRTNSISKVPVTRCSAVDISGRKERTVCCFSVSLHKKKICLPCPVCFLPYLATAAACLPA